MKNDEWQLSSIVFSSIKLTAFRVGRRANPQKQKLVFVERIHNFGSISDLQLTTNHGILKNC